jgi:hypothetical protein
VHVPQKFNLQHFITFPQIRDPQFWAVERGSIPDLSERILEHIITNDIYMPHIFYLRISTQNCGFLRK